MAIGYKVMKTEDGEIISGRDSRIKFKPEVGKVLKMGGNGIYLSPHKDYVIDYYSGLADEEVLLTLEFDPDTIITGDLNDNEPEISVPKVKIVDIEELQEESIFECILEALLDKNYIISIDTLYESYKKDFNIDKSDLKDLNNVTLTHVFNAIDMSLHRNDPIFVASVIEPITEYMKDFLDAPTNLDQLAQFIISKVEYFDERLAMEIHSIFDGYDRTYICISNNMDNAEIFRHIKDDFPEIEDWKIDFVDGKVQYERVDSHVERLILVVQDLIELFMYEQGTLCSIYKEVDGEKILIHDEVIPHCKYIPCIIDNIDSEFKK